MGIESELNGTTTEKEEFSMRGGKRRRRSHRNRRGGSTRKRRGDSALAQMAVRVLLADQFTRGAWASA